MRPLPIAPNVLTGAIPKDDLVLTTQDFVDRLIIPMRRPRSPLEGPRGGRKEGLMFDPAPEWAGELVRVLSETCFRYTEVRRLLGLARRLLRSEERARAALAVIATSIPSKPLRNRGRSFVERDLHALTADAVERSTPYSSCLLPESQREKLLEQLGAIP